MEQHMFLGLLKTCWYIFLTQVSDLLKLELDCGSRRQVKCISQLNLTHVSGWRYIVGVTTK